MKPILFILALVFASCASQNPLDPEQDTRYSELTGTWLMLLETETGQRAFDLTVTQYGDRIALKMVSSVNKNTACFLSGRVIYTNYFSLEGANYPEHYYMGASYDSTFSALTGVFTTESNVLGRNTRPFTAIRWFPTLISKNMMIP